MSDRSLSPEPSPAVPEAQHAMFATTCPKCGGRGAYGWLSTWCHVCGGMGVLLFFHRALRPPSE